MAQHSRPGCAMILRAFAIVLASSILFNPAHAAQIRVICPGALKGPMESLTLEFERMNGHKVELVFDIINSIAERIRNGQPFDLAFETPTQWAALAADGKLDPAVHANIASVKWALYVRKGAAKPKIDTAETVRQALLSAKSIAYSSVQGPIRAYQAQVTEK